MTLQPLAQDAEPGQPRVYTVAELTGDVRAILEAAFDRVWVEGEISNLRVAASKHTYFVLKDDKAQIRCVLFRGHRAGLRFDPEEGDQVLLHGRVTVYEARGEYQIIVETMEPRGLGALQKAFEQLKAKLAEEGLFDEARKRPIPPIPWKVGVVTSATGAAVRDILNIIRRRNPKVSVLVHPVKVQGEGAAREIAAAIGTMNEAPGLDVLIVGRGGGSIEDLWAFNEEVVARAIAASKLPVVSAVGHEIDFTIADFVADLRAPTPSAAAELTVPRLGDLARQARELAEELVEEMQERIARHKEFLRHCMDRRFFREPHRILEQKSQRLDDFNLRLQRSLDQWAVVQRNRLTGRVQQLFQLSPGKQARHLEEKRASLEHQLIGQMIYRLRYERKRFDGVVKNLNAVSPLAVLDRGYSICLHAGKVVKDSKDVKQGAAVEIRLARGRLDCTVDKTHKPAADTKTK